MNIPPEAKVVAEIGCVHLGKMERAKELIKLASMCGADYAKFQKRNPDECVPEELKNKPHPNKIFAYGDTYLEHRRALELDIHQHQELSDYCDTFGIRYAVSVWDMTSAQEVIKNVKSAFIKIPSPCNNDWSLIDMIKSDYDGDIHISTGMSSHDDVYSIINRFTPIANRVVIYHCTSIYPCPFDKLHLLEIKRLSELTEYGFRIGFSNHGYGIAADIVAWSLGAEYIERHFVDDRTLKHTDAAASLEPEGMRRLTRDLKNVRRALSYSPSQPDDAELEERRKLRKNNL
jgi:sialic acid synthase